MKTSKYAIPSFSIEQVDEVPEFEDLALLVENGDVQTFAGQPMKIRDAIVAYQKDLRAIVARLKSGSCPGDFFVPDFWHVTYGRARLFVEEDAARLYEAWTLGWCIGTNYMTRDDSLLLNDNFRGTLFHPKT